MSLPLPGSGASVASNLDRQAASSTILRPSVLRGQQQQNDWSTIDWVQAGESAQLRTGEAQRRARLGDDEFRVFFASGSVWLAAILGGLLMGFLAVLIEIGTRFVSSIRIGVCSGYFWLNRELCCPGEGEDCADFVTWGELLGGPSGTHTMVSNYFMYVMLGTLFAGTAAVFCRNFSMHAAGGGINEVKTVVSGHVVSDYFSAWVTVVKSIGVCMSTGSGLAVGKEGPFVHLGSCCADLVGGIFPAFENNGLRRELISAGAGGGLAVAFGAPIGGVVFAIEEISSFFSFRSMMQSLMFGVCSVLVVKQFDIMHTGRIVQFSIDYQHKWHWFELPLFALVGVFGGLVGSLYNVCNMAIIKKRKTTFVKQWPITEVILIAIVSNVLNFVIPFCKGGMLELLAELFQDCTGNAEEATGLCRTNQDLTLMVSLVLAGVAKTAMSVATVGTCVPAGLLVPSLVIGGLFGRAFGVFFNALQVQTDSRFFSACEGLNLCIIPGVYAIVGAASVLTGVTRMTVCLAVIMFELTGGVEYLVPVIVGILMSKWTGEAVGVECIYELGIEFNSMPYLDPKKEFTQSCLTEEIFAGKKFTCLYNRGMTLNDINDVLEQPFHGFPLVTSASNAALLGYVPRTKLIGALRAVARSHRPEVTAQTCVRFSDKPQPVLSATDAGGLMDRTRRRSVIEPERRRTEDGDVEVTLDFSSCVENSDLQVAPDCSVARLLYLFKSLGARHVLVSRFGRFVGVVTKKDLIEFMRCVEHAEHAEEEELGRSVG